MEENITAVAGEAAGTAEPAIAEQALPQKKKRKPINQQKLQDNIWGWAFCLPLIIGTVWFVYIAFVMALLLSFTGYRTGSTTPLLEYLFSMGEHLYTGYNDPNTLEIEKIGGAFGWYAQIFLQTTATDASLRADGIVLNEMGAYMFNTVFYLIGIPIGMVLSVFFAVCMSRDINGGNVFRVLYYLPCVASTVAIVYTFKIMFKPQGVINSLFGLTNVEIGGSIGGFKWLPIAPDIGYSWNDLTGGTGGSAFMRDPFWCQGIFSKLVIITLSVWKGLGGTIILYVAGLSGVNAATKEAAQIDGANGWQIFWKVTMPDLYPVIFYNVVTAVIGGMQIYMEPELLMGGENVLTSGYVSLIYRYGITDKNAGGGAAYGMFLAVIIFALTLFQFWLDSRNKD